jgi:probable phosphoglycerate mutase
VVIAFMRHASTAWNLDGRMQGHRDILLCDTGRAEAMTWQLPSSDWREPTEWISSPLARAVETATIVGGRMPRIERALIEMDWGEWEGERLDALGARYGEAYVANARRGLDFRPPGGESPREVMARLDRWIASLETRRPPIVAVTHNGVLRALLAIVTGWDMTGKAPVKLRPATLHRVALARDGKLDGVEWNVPLAALSATRPAPPSLRPPAPSKALP